MAYVSTSMLSIDDHTNHLSLALILTLAASVCIGGTYNIIISIKFTMANSYSRDCCAGSCSVEEKE